MSLMPDASHNAPDASAIGTTVLQIKEIPKRPPEFDGALCLFGVPEAALCLFGIGEADICDRLRAFGDIVSYEAGAGSMPNAHNCGANRDQPCPIGLGGGWLLCFA